jgi:N-acetylmuramoyl-L-alanine amidase CwlA
VEFGLEEEDIIRHYDVTGKLCPLYYVEHEEEWLQFRRDVMAEADRLKKGQS